MLRLVHAVDEPVVEYHWFCGHCAAPAEGMQPPAPAARVCNACGLGLMLEARADVAPAADEAFLVVDGALRVQAVSRSAEQLLGVGEDRAVNQPVARLLAGADAELSGTQSFAGAVIAAVADGEEPVQRFVRPSNTFGVRMRARIAPCGPPRAALIVLDASPPPIQRVP